MGALPKLDQTLEMSESGQLLSDGRLTLRHPEESDADAVVTAVLASINELSPWMPWATPAYDASTAKLWISGQLGDVHRFVMVDEDSEIIGSCGLNRLDENGCANLGYWVRSDRAGKGIATAATRLLHDFGLGGAGLHRLEVIMSVRNEASHRVAEKAGAHYEGIMRGALLLSGEHHDAHLWSFTAD